MKKMVTTVREYDPNGKLTKETTTEVIESNPASNPSPVFPQQDKTPWNGLLNQPYRQTTPWWEYITVTCNV